MTDKDLSDQDVDSVLVHADEFMTMMSYLGSDSEKPETQERFAAMSRQQLFDEFMEKLYDGCSRWLVETDTAKEYIMAHNLSMDNGSLIFRDKKGSGIIAAFAQGQWRSVIQWR